MDVEKTIREYLPQVIHLSLATCRDNRPWVCEVHFAYDNDLNLYFISRASRRHSKEMADNERVAGNIVTQHVIDQKPRGVYFEGKGMLLEDVDEYHPAYTLYSERFGVEKEILDEAKTPEGYKFYKIEVDAYYFFDARDSHPSKKYELPWRKH